MSYGYTTPQRDRSMNANQLPVFVYGTLRNGQGNYGWALNGRTTAELLASLDDADMFGIGRGFPYVADGIGTVIGELMYIGPEHFTDVLADLDRLEGYSGPGLHNHYDRLIRSVRLDEGTAVDAWVYLLGPERASRLTEEDRIVTGDWLAQAPTWETCS